jgi:hypothetical protein
VAALEGRLRMTAATQAPKGGAGGALSRAEWDELLRMSGGPTRLLDALEGLAAQLLEAELARKQAPHAERSRRGGLRPATPEELS